MMNKWMMIIASALIVARVASAQEVKTVRRVVELQKQQMFHLTRMMSSRAYLPVEVPLNTIEWYISFSSTTDGNSAPLKLFGQLTKFVDPTGITSVAMDALTVPSGTSYCNVMVTDQKNMQRFMSKSDNYDIYENASRKNLTHGIIKIDGRYKGSLQILLYNPAYMSSINATIEVTAIVADRQVDRTVWVKDIRDKLFDSYYAGFVKKNMEATPARDLAGCIVENICSCKSPEEVGRMSKFELGKLSDSIATKCLQSLQGGEKTDAQQKAITYSNLGWKAYESGDVDKCIEYSRKGLALDSTMGWAQANMGLCHLIKGDSTTAVEYYIVALSLHKKDRLAGRRHIEAEIKDIDDALTRYPGMQGYKDIRDLLTFELKR